MIARWFDWFELNRQKYRAWLRQVASAVFLRPTGTNTQQTSPSIPGFQKLAAGIGNAKAVAVAPNLRTILKTVIEAKGEIV